MAFTKATKRQARLRLGLIGPSGSGKTYSALGIASGLGDRIALVDTERGSASKYADKFSFDVLELESFEPGRFIQAIHDAEQAGYDVLIIDSLSHAWMGKGGILEMADTEAKRSKSGSSFNAWREVTPKHNALVDAMLRSKCHIIATLRAKTEYVIEKDEKGRNTPRKVGLAPVQRDGLEYEFDLVGDLDNAELVVTKTRCPLYAKAVIHEPGESTGRQLRAWLEDGEPAQPTSSISSPAEKESSSPTESQPASKLEQIKAQVARVHGPQATVREVTPDDVWADLVQRAEDAGLNTNDLGQLIVAATGKTRKADLTSADRAAVTKAIQDKAEEAQ